VKSLKKVSIKWKVMSILLLITVIPLVASGYFIQRNNYKNLKSTLQQQGKTNLKVINNRLHREEKRLSEVGNRLLQDKELMQAIKRQAPTEVYVRMNKYIERENLDFLTFATPDGQVIRRGNNSRNFEDQLPFSQVFKQVTNKQKPITTYVEYPAELVSKEDTPSRQLSQRLQATQEGTSGLVMLRVIPIEFLNEVQAIFIVGQLINDNSQIYNQELENLVFTAKKEANDYMSGIRFEGDYIIANNQFWSSKDGFQLNGDKVSNSFLTFKSAIKNNSGEKLATVVYGISRTKLKNSVQENFWIMFRILFSVVILIIVISFLISTKISKKIEKIIGKLKKIAAGDLTVRLEIDSEDELGELGQEFNETIADQKQILQQISDSVNKITDYSHQLSSSAGESNQLTDETAENMTEITTAIKEIANSSQEISDLAQKAYTETDSGVEQIEQMEEKMEEIDKAAEEAREIINSLNDTSQQIVEIVDMITGIAEETNLLALNASIEAARASSALKGSGTRRGEAGQGFAVVAEEIKELAEETTKATDRAIELIEETQIKSSQGLKAIEDVTNQTKQGTELIGKTNQTFDDIAEQIEDTSAYTEEATASSEELAASSEDVNQAAEQMDKISDEVAKSAEDLAEMANKLEKLVCNYKL